MQLLSLLSSPTAPGTSAAPAQSGTGTPATAAGFGLLVEGLIRPLVPGMAKPATGTATPDATPATQSPDDAALAALMQAMGLTMPTATQPTAPIATALGLPTAEAAIAAPAATPQPALPAGTLPPAPVPALAGAAPQPATPVPAGTIPSIPVQTAAIPVNLAATTPGTDAAATLPDTTPATAASTPDPTAAVAAVPLAAAPVDPQTMAVAQAAAPPLAAVTPVTDGKPAPDAPSTRPVSRARPAGAPTATAQPAQGSEARPAATTRTPVDGFATALAEPAPAPAQASTAGTNPDGSLLPASLTTTTTQAMGRDMATHAVSAARPAMASHAAPGLQLVGRIEQAVAEDQTTLTVQLDPEHLGRVEVKLEMQDGRITAMIAAEKPATLDLLQRDVRLIERALQQGGMQVQPDGLQFSLREGAGQWAQAEQGRRGAQLYGQQVQADPALDPLTPAIIRSDSLVDIQI